MNDPATNDRVVVDLVSIDAAARAAAERAEIAACREPGICVVATVPGADVAAIGAALRGDGRRVLVLCASRRSEDAHRDATMSVLVAPFIASVMAMAFTPATRARRRRLAEHAPALFIRAAHEVGWSPAPGADPARLARAVCQETALGRSVPVAVRRAFWRRAAVADGDVVDAWVDELAELPEPLLAFLSSHAIEAVLVPDGAFLDKGEAVLLGRLAAEGIRVVVTLDLRGTVADVFAGLAPQVHWHAATVSRDRSPEVVAALAATDAGRRHGLVIATCAARGPATTVDVYLRRETLVAALAAGLATVPGVGATDAAAALMASVAPVDLGIADLSGATVLIVTPRPSESVELARQLGSYLVAEPEMLGDDRLWRAKAALCCQVLDPSGIASGDADTSAQAVVASVRSLAGALWARRYGRRPLPVDIAALAGLGAWAEERARVMGEALYGEAVDRACGALGKLRRTATPELASFADELATALRHHVTLLGDDATLAELLGWGHEIVDFRALGFTQASSGAQRWYPRPATLRARGGERLAVAAELDRELHSRRHATRPLRAEPGHVGLYVTHVQRVGYDEVDHVIIARTLYHHLPYTGQGHDRAVEDALFYRAIGCARRSVHLVFVGTSPYLRAPIRDHR